MIKNYSPNPKSGGLTLWLTLILLVSPPVFLKAEGASAPKYKKNTVVDFEGALVEGKSRKPYSSYLTQQKESAFEELHQWSPDLEKGLQDSAKKVNKKL
jgi:hypothetical protein